MPRALPRYEITTRPPRPKKGEEPAAPLEVETDTQVRRAIRRAIKLLRTMKPRTQVTVRGWQPGDHPQWRGRVEYQAHVDADGKIHVEER